MWDKEERKWVCMRARDNEQTNWEFTQQHMIQPTSYSPKKTKQMHMHTSDHFPFQSQPGRGRNDSAFSTRQTLKIDTFCRNFWHDLWPDLGLTTAIIQLTSSHLTRACLSCDITLIYLRRVLSKTNNNCCWPPIKDLEKECLLKLKCLHV